MTSLPISLRRAAARRLPAAPLTAVALAITLIAPMHAQAQEPATATLDSIEVREATGPATRTPGERAAVTLAPKALPTTVQQLNQDDIASTNVGRDISNVFRRVPGVLANNIDQGETGNGFRMRGFATQGTHGADTAV